MSKAKAAMLITAMNAIIESAKPVDHPKYELPGRKKEDMQVKKAKKMAEKSQKKNRRIQAKKRKFSGRRNKK